MATNTVNSNRNDDEHNEYYNSVFHPHNVLLTLLLFGVTALFLAFTGAFIYTRVQNNLPPIHIPPIFLLNTLVLIGSSMTMIWARKNYLADETAKYQHALLATMALTILFMVLQFIGWQQLKSNGLWVDTDNSMGYLYVISFLHLAHVVVGLPFLFLFWLTAKKRMKEPVSVLVYFSDPEKQLKLRLLTRYWHFLDILWIYLVLFFGLMWVFG